MLAEFAKTIWGINQVTPDTREQLYHHFNAAKASADPALYWAKIATLVRILPTLFPPIKQQTTKPPLVAP
jgi:hypothetical protein